MDSVEKYKGEMDKKSGEIAIIKEMEENLKSMDQLRSYIRGRDQPRITLGMPIQKFGERHPKDQNILNKEIPDLEKELERQAAVAAQGGAEFDWGNPHVLREEVAKREQDYKRAASLLWHHTDEKVALEGRLKDIGEREKYTLEVIRKETQKLEGLKLDASKLFAIKRRDNDWVRAGFLPKRPGKGGGDGGQGGGTRRSKRRTKKR